MEDFLEKNALSPYMTELCQSSSAIRKMDQIAKEMVKKYGEDSIHNFSIGNPRVPPPEEYEKIMLDTLNDKDFFLPHGYAPNTGDQEGREAIAELFSKIQGVNISYENVILSAGCAGAINIFLRTILIVGDEVIIPSPYFLEYPYYIENFHGKAVYCETKFEEGWQINKERFEKCFTAQTRCVIINSPQNPTGIVYTDETIKMISELCEKYSKKYGRPIWILSDDVYCRVLRPGKKHHQIFKFYKYSVICYSVSKDLSLPGERIGALIMNPEIKLVDRNIHAISMSNEFLAIYPPNRLHMRALPKLLKYTSEINLYSECQDIIEKTLKKLNIQYVQPEGAFYLFPKIPDGIDELEFCKCMVENFIVVVPGSAFGAEGFYRLSFCKKPEDIKRGMEQFEKAYKNVINELGKPDHKKDESDKEENANNKKFPETNKFIYC
jgi:aspartate aminotransferase